MIAHCDCVILRLFDISYLKQKGSCNSNVYLILGDNGVCIGAFMRVFLSVQ